MKRIAFLLCMVAGPAAAADDPVTRSFKTRFCRPEASIAAKAMTKADKVLQELKTEVSQQDDGYEYRYFEVHVDGRPSGLRFNWRKLKSRREWMQCLVLGKWRTYHDEMFKTHPRESNLIGVELEGKWVYFVAQDANYNPVQYQPNQQYQMKPMQYYMPAVQYQTSTTYQIAPARRFIYRSSACAS